MPSPSNTTAPTTQTCYLDMMHGQFHGNELLQHLKVKINDLNPSKMKHSYSLGSKNLSKIKHSYSISGQRLSHKISFNVKNIQQRVNSNHRPMISVYTFNQESTLPRQHQRPSNLYNHPLLNVHREQYALPLHKKHAARTLNPFTGRRVILRKDLFDQSINVQYQKTILGIPFNVSAENIDLDRNLNRPLHPGVHSGVPQNRIEDIHLVKVERPIEPRALQPQHPMRS